MRSRGNKVAKFEESNAPVLSIVVPVYNTVRYLGECLDSLLGQTFKDFEIICVDDGSTDGSSALLDARALEDCRMDVHHLENGGVSAARNYGLSRARGEYVLFVDSDDFIELTMCEKLINTARRDDSDIVVFGGVTFPHVEWIDRCFDTHDVLVRGSGVKALLEEAGSFPLMCNKMYRRSLIADNKVSFSTELVLGEDNAFQFSVFPYARTVSFLSDAFYHYRCGRSGSAISTFYGDRLAKVRKHLDVVRYVFCDWQKKGILEENAGGLLRWSSGFLHGDVIKLEYCDRLEISQTYKGICESCGLLSAIDELDSFERDICSFLFSDGGVVDAPDVSIVMFPGRGEHAGECFCSVSSQSCQSLEILFVDEGLADDAFMDLVRRDPRACLFESAGEAIASIRGDYTIVTTADAAYDWTFVERMLASARREEADVVSCFDRGNRLHVPSDDVERMLRTRSKGAYSMPDCPPDKHFAAFSPDDVPEHALSMLSLNPVNKLIRSQHLKECSESGNKGPLSLLARARRLAILPYPLVMLRSRALSVEESGSFAGLCAAVLADSYSGLQADRKSFALANSWASGAASFVLSSYDLVSGYDGKRAFVGAIRDCLEGSEAMRAVLSDDSLSGGVRRRLQAMMNRMDEDGRFVEEDMRNVIEQLTGRLALCEDAILCHEVERHEFYHSKSYRLGHFFGASLRRGAALVSRVVRIERGW